MSNLWLLITPQFAQRAMQIAQIRAKNEANQATHDEIIRDARNRMAALLLDSMKKNSELYGNALKADHQMAHPYDDCVVRLRDVGCSQDACGCCR
jgi:hypothetical protein